ncbi:MAG: hypothetical protein V4692_14080, partial [Bdellovibrionota bacterium]
MSRSDIEFFEEQKYLTEISPMEWVTFIIMKPTADDDIKLELANIVEQFSQDTDLGLGVQANSISPSDRKSALTNTELFEIRKAWKKSAAPVQKSYTAATLSSWEKVPHF